MSCHRFDSPRGPATYLEWHPPPLAGVVESLFYFEGPTLAPSRRVLPDGRLGLLVNFGEPYRMVEGAGVERLSAAWATGIQMGATVVRQPAYQRILGIRLLPAGARSVLGLPLAEVSDLVVDLKDLVGSAAAELMEACHGSTSPVEMLQRAARWVDRRSRGGTPPGPGRRRRLHLRARGHALRRAQRRLRRPRRQPLVPGDLYRPLAPELPGCPSGRSDRALKEHLGARQIPLAERLPVDRSATGSAEALPRIPGLKP